MHCDLSNLNSDTNFDQENFHEKICSDDDIITEKFQKEKSKSPYFCYNNNILDNFNTQDVKISDTMSNEIFNDLNQILITNDKNNNIIEDFAQALAHEVIHEILIEEHDDPEHDPEHDPKHDPEHDPDAIREILNEEHEDPEHDPDELFLVLHPPLEDDIQNNNTGYINTIHNNLNHTYKVERVQHLEFLVAYIFIKS